MGIKYRRYLREINKIPSIHYIYLSSYPVESLTEIKEMNIIGLIQNPVIFVMRGPVDASGVTTLLHAGDGVMFDYEQKHLDLPARISAHLGKPFISPGIKNFISSDLQTMPDHTFNSANFIINTSSTPKNKTVTQLLLALETESRPHSVKRGICNFCERSNG